jgi:TonB family protein
MPAPGLDAPGRLHVVLTIATLVTLLAVTTAGADMTVDVSSREDIARWYPFAVGEQIQERLRGLTFPAGSAALEIRRDGTIAELVLTRSSGVPAADGLALRAIQDAAPFPGVPPEEWRLVIPLDVRWHPKQ